MNPITLRVLDGADRGRVFELDRAPITIGREEGNTIQLNDERVSRFHIKIQQDHEDLVLTDLESTNGTKVNGEDVQLRILRHGDMISVGRSTLVFGSRSEINDRFDRLSKSERVDSAEKMVNSEKDSVSVRNDWKENPNYQLALLDMDPPGLPDRLSPGQAAQLSEVLEFFHMHLRRIIGDIEFSPRSTVVELPVEQWQKIVDLQSRLAEYLRRIGHQE
ncbi:MAG: FHA domain-containing protein [Planctomycetota bacterium]